MENINKVIEHHMSIEFVVVKVEISNELTLDKEYVVIDNDKRNYQIMNDSGIVYWYDRSYFK